MKIKAVSFDIGHTLVKYNNPLNWKFQVLTGQSLENGIIGLQWSLAKI